jgi:nicotinate-nucleotide adenylyltransferase
MRQDHRPIKPMGIRLIPFRALSQPTGALLSQSILIFGGTFDPPHLAHASLPPQVASRIHCRRIIYVPASINPLKADEPPAPAHHRLAMLRIGIREVPGAEISTIELDRDGPSYTIETIESLRTGFGPDAELRLLIGADQALDFQRWRRWQDIMALATPAVMLRAPLDHSAFESELSTRWAPEWVARWLDWTVDVPLMDISATEIRRRLAAGADTTGLLDEHVREYIERHGLYATRSSPGVSRSRGK